MRILCMGGWEVEGDNRNNRNKRKKTAVFTSPGHLIRVDSVFYVPIIRKRIGTSPNKGNKPLKTGVITLNRHLILGIDPGFSGALAVLAPIDPKGGARPQLVDVIDMPLKPEGFSISPKAARQVLDPVKLGAWLSKYQQHLTLAVIEHVTASSQMGVVSAFRFGEGYGVLTGIIYGLGIPQIVKPTPSVWKGTLGLSPNKSESVERAKALFGDKYFSLRKHDGRAEASLLAYYGIRLLPVANGGPQCPPQGVPPQAVGSLF